MPEVPAGCYFDLRAGGCPNLLSTGRIYRSMAAWLCVLAVSGMAQTLRAVMSDDAIPKPCFPSLAVRSEASGFAPFYELFAFVRPDQALPASVSRLFQIWNKAQEMD